MRKWQIQHNPEHTLNLRNALEAAGYRPVLEHAGGGYATLVIELDVITGQCIVITNADGTLTRDGEIHSGWMAINYPSDESYVFGTDGVYVYDSTVENNVPVYDENGALVECKIIHVDSKHDSMLLVQAIDAHLINQK